MLLHIRPRLISPFKHVALIDLEIAPLGMRLTGGVDLATRRPYPNKRYAVACRKKGHKAIDGILVETKTPVDELHTTARWAIDASVSVTHDVHYKLLDHDFDAASDDAMLWHACCAELGSWSSRLPAKREPEPMMEIKPRNSDRHSNTRDFVDEKGLITKRIQTYAMPTIERARILDTRLNTRIPLLDTAFCL